MSSFPSKSLLTALLFSVGFASSAFSAPLEYLGGLTGVNYGFATSISSDGKTVAGLSNVDGAYYWTEADGLINLGAFNAYDSMSTPAISGNGMVITGFGYDSLGGFTEAYRWTLAGGFVGLSYLTGGTYSMSSAINSDGSVIVGTADSSLYSSEAFRWVDGVGMTGLGTLAGGTYSSARGVSGDGSIVVGESGSGTPDSEAWKWTQGTNMVSLGFLSGFTSSKATGISSDGSTIIGLAGNPLAMEAQAIMWKQGNPAVTLGAYAGITGSMANAVNADGSIIVGTAFNASYDYEAFRWTQATGMESLASVLTNSGANLTGWQLLEALDVSDDGNVIVGTGMYNGNQLSYITNLLSGGITTPDNILQSIAGVATTTQQIAATSSNQMGQSLFQARNLIASNNVTPSSGSTSSLNNISTAAGGPYRTMWQMYTTGSFGIGQNNDFNNNDLNGTVGVKAHITPEIAIGGGVIGSTARSDMVFGGQSEVQSYGVSGIAAYAPIDNGLRVYGSMFAAALDLNIRRGYLNGASFDSSRGETDGFAYGAAGQVGWNMPITNRYSVMPYTEMRYSKTKADGYTENGGAFAGSFSSQEATNTTGRIGIENNFALTNDINLMGRAAIAHRLSGQGSGVTASVSGITQNLSGNTGDKTWAEGAVGGGYQVSERTYLNGELGARTGDLPEPTLTATVGLSVKF